MSLAIEPDFIRALTQLPPGEAPLHQRLAKATGRRSDNTLVTLKKYAEAGWLDQESFAPTPALRGMFGETGSESGGKDGSAALSPVHASREAASRDLLNMIPLNRLAPSGLNYRKTFDAEALEQLADSLLAQGQLQNILVRPDPDQAGHYQIVAGERRFRAFRRLAERGDVAETVPVRVEIRELDDAAVLEAAITENAARADVDKLEEAEAYARLKSIYEARGQDAGQATGDIAERLGCTRRLVQRRIRTIEHIIPEVREAWNEGSIPSFAMAEELSRWPGEVQKDALAAIVRGGWNAPGDAAELKRWLIQDAPRVGDQPFSLDVYTEAGGTFIEPENEDEPRRFADKALAQECLEHWCGTKAVELNAKHGYEGEPIIAGYFSSHTYPEARKAPAHLQRVFFEADIDMMRVHVHHPVARREDLEAENQAATSAPAGNTADGEASDNAAPAATPYARRNWLAGAKARTEHFRETIESNHNIAVALAIVALLPGGKGWNSPEPVYIGPSHISGDANVIGEGETFRAYLAATPCEGIETDSAFPVQVTDRGKAIASLIRRSDLAALFGALIADLTIDCGWQAQAGACAAAMPIMKPVPQVWGLRRLPGGTDWLKGYTIEQLLAIGEADGIDMSDAPSAKKALVPWLAERLSNNWTPPEAKFTDAKTMQAAVDKVLSSGRPS